MTSGNWTRRRVLGATAAATLAASPALPCCPAARRRSYRPAGRPVLTHGVQSGDAVGNSAYVWTRADRVGRMLVELSDRPDFRHARWLRGPLLTPDTDFTGKLRLTGQGWGINPEFGGMRIFDANLRAFAAEVPQINQWDDHEVRNNWYPGQILDDPRYTEKRIDVLAAPAKRAFHEWVPVPEGPIYRKLSFGPLLDLFILDMRTYKDPNDGNVYADPTHGLLGAEQREWLIRGLTQSRATRPGPRSVTSRRSGSSCPGRPTPARSGRTPWTGRSGRRRCSSTRRRTPTPRRRGLPAFR